jgi:hypothetical protein
MMKKSKAVVLSGLFLTALACVESKPEGEWISGNEDGKTRDTTINNNSYRYYGGMWYPIYGGMINPGIYNGATTQQIAKPGFQPASLQKGGFGSTSRSSSSGRSFVGS